MDRKTLTLLGILLPVVAIAAFLAVKRASRPSDERVLWSGDAAKASRLVVTTPAGRLELVKKGDVWELAAPLSFPADGTSVQNLFEKLPKTFLSGPLTESRDRRETYGLGASAVRLQLEGGAPLDVWAGKATADNEAVYVRLEGSDAVYEARGLARFDLEKSSADWASKAVVAAPTSGLERVVLKSTAATVALAASPAGWKVEGRSVALSSAPGSPLNGVQGSLADLQADRLQFAPLPALPGRPVLEVRVSWKEKGAPREALFKAYTEKDGLIPLVKEGEARVRYLLYPWRLESLKRAAMELR